MKRKLTKTISTYILLIFTLILLSGSLTGCSKNSSKSQLIIDDKNTSKTVSVLNENGKTFVAIKEAFEYLGGTCTIEGNTATAKKGKDTVKVESNSSEAFLNSNKIKMSSNPKVKSKDIYVPIEFLNEVIDAKFSFDEEKKALNIKTEMPLLYSKGFSVKYLKGGIKKVTDGEKRTLILVPEGKEVPEEFKNEKIIKTPLKNVLLASTTQACLLRPLGELTSVKGVTTPVEQWYIDEVKKGIENSQITFVGDNMAPDYEKISALKPDMAFVYSGGSGMGDQNLAQKFDELKINYAVENGWLEQDPLGRMEWMKLVAAFYNKEDMAEKYFNDAVKKVEDIKKQATKGEKPKVAWATIFNGEVYIPNADSYVAKMIEMAGGEYIFKDAGAGSGKVSLEEFYAKAKDANVFIYSATKDWAPTLKGVVEQAPTLEKMSAVQNKNVWCYHPDYYQSLDKTDELISDLAGIFHPENNSTDNVKHYIKYTE